MTLTNISATLPERLDPTTPPGPEKVVMRKPIERVKRAQSKIYEEDDINIWDDDSELAKTLIFEPDGKVLGIYRKQSNLRTFSSKA